jgi:hypothetical protein
MAGGHTDSEDAGGQVQAEAWDLMRKYRHQQRADRRKLFGSSPPTAYPLQQENQTNKPHKRVDDTGIGLLAASLCHNQSRI